jgi:outer membrane lipoprotein-sorting protein
MKTRYLILICVLAIIFASDVMAQNPKEIVRKMDLNMNGDNSYSEMTMQTVRPRYTREISLKAWSMSEEYQLVYITEPARDKGTAFLKRGKEMWNYVPSIDRTVKMPPSMMSQSWMGSDFSNDDMVQGISIVDDYTHKLLRSETIGKHDCYVIEMIPNPDTPVAFSKVIQWVSKEHYLPVKVENYDDRNVLASTINFSEIKKFGSKNFPTIMELIPADKKGHKTVLTTHKMDLNIKLETSFFSMQNLSNVR